MRTEPRGPQLAATETVEPGWNPEPLNLTFEPGVTDQLLTKGTKPVADCLGAATVYDAGVVDPSIENASATNVSPLAAARARRPHLTIATLRGPCTSV
jgi:hypothetical protein